MSARIQWAVTAALLTLFVIGLQSLALQQSAAHLDDARQAEFKLTLRRVATDWQLHAESAEAELQGGLPHDAQRMREEGLKAILQRAPQSDANLAAGAAFLLAFGATEPARAMAQQLHADGLSEQPLVQALRGTHLEPAAFLEALEASPLPESARLRLRAWAALQAGPQADPVETKVLLAAIGQAEQAARSRTRAIQIVLVAIGFFGLIGVFAFAPISWRLHQLYTGLLSPGPFEADFLKLYTVVMGWVAFTWASGLALQLLAPGAFSGSEAPAWIAVNTAVSGAVGLWLVSLVAVPPGRLSLSDLGLTTSPFRTRALGALAWGALAWSMTVPITAVTMLLSEVIFGPTPQITNPVVLVLAEAGSLPAMLTLALGSAVIAPLVEEILFRGFLYRALRDRLGPVSGALVTSAVFAMLHPSAHTLLPLFALSCGLCFLTERTGSLWPAAVAHGLNNLGALIWMSASLGVM